MLRSLLQSADLSQYSLEACFQAFNQLQWVFNSLRSSGAGSGGGADVVFAWHIMISSEFTDLTVTL